MHLFLGPVVQQNELVGGPNLLARIVLRVREFTLRFLPFRWLELSEEPPGNLFCDALPREV